LKKSLGELGCHLPVFLRSGWIGLRDTKVSLRLQRS